VPTGAAPRIFRGIEVRAEKTGTQSGVAKTNLHIKQAKINQKLLLLA